MDINTNLSKHIGTKASRFILGLYDQGKTIFTVEDAASLSGLRDQSLQKFLAPLVKRGILNRLVYGLYRIVPFELGSATEYMGSPYVVAREIVRHKLKGQEPQYFISHASAFEIHQMVTQPHMDIYVTTTKQIKGKISVMGTDFHFVTCKEKDFFGFKKHWIDKSEMVFMSDLERTIIDGLKLPEYCSGIPEVAKGLWMKRNEIDCDKLLGYAKKVDSGVVYRRLGFLLDLYKIGSRQLIEDLQEALTASYQLLDPTQINEGKYYSRWRLRLNVSEDELLAMVRT